MGSYARARVREHVRAYRIGQHHLRGATASVCPHTGTVDDHVTFAESQLVDVRPYADVQLLMRAALDEGHLAIAHQLLPDSPTKHPFGAGYVRRHHTVSASLISFIMSSGSIQLSG